MSIADLITRSIDSLDDYIQKAEKNMQEMSMLLPCMQDEAERADMIAVIDNFKSNIADAKETRQKMLGLLPTNGKEHPIIG